MTDFKNYFANPKLPGTMNIEYSQLGDIPGNSEAHFREAIRLGFDGLKCDMELTADGEIVLCHDEGYTFDADGRITSFIEQPGKYTPIRQMTLDQIMSHQFALPFNGQYCSPCTLDTMLRLCEQYNLVAYLTLRPEPWRQETARRMAELILAHHLEERTIINLYPGSQEAMQLVESLIPNLVYCNTCLPDTKMTTGLIDSSAADGYRIICICRIMIETVTPEISRYAAEKGLRLWSWGSSNTDYCIDDLSRGITGFQMYNRMVSNSVLAELYHQYAPSLA